MVNTLPNFEYYPIVVAAAASLNRLYISTRNAETHNDEL